MFCMLSTLAIMFEFMTNFKVYNCGGVCRFTTADS